MQIDLSLATVEWLETWIAEQQKGPMNMISRRMPRTPENAVKRFIDEQLESYFSRADVRGDQVMLYTDSISADDLMKILPVTFKMASGTVVKFSEIDSDSYYEFYDDEPSNKIVLVFRTKVEDNQQLDSAAESA